MSHIAFCLLILAQGEPTLPPEIEIDSSQLTLTEHADVSSSEAGLLRELTVKEGDSVAEGNPLARIDDREARLVRARAETEFKIAKSLADNDVKVRFARLAVAVAEAELKRAVESNQKFPKSVSQTELDRLRLVSDKAVLEVEQADLEQHQAKLSLLIKQQDLDRANLALERRTITAPFPGVVVQWKKHQGEWVEPGAPVLRLIRLNRLRAEAFLSSRKLVPNLLGRPVTFVIAGPGRAPSRHEGKLEFISPEIDPVNGQVRIWAEIKNDDLSVYPGQTGRLIIGHAPLER
jgi:RND family efflux transporter MFP subunit